MLRRLALLFVLTFAATPSLADEAPFDFGGDSYVAGQNPTISQPVAHDAFMGGNTVSLAGTVAGDALLAGFNVNVGAPVAGDIYAAGFSVNVNAPVAGAVTAAGNSVALAPGATVGGNVRLAGQSVAIDGPITGSALVGAQTLTLANSVGGDLRFYGETMNFGPNAKVGGTLFIETPKPVEVPASVAPAERVRYTALPTPPSGAPSVAPVGLLGGAIAWWIVLILIGAGLIAFAPRRFAAMSAVAQVRPWRNLGMGALALAAGIGLVPLTAMTLIGLVLTPFAILAFVLFCIFAYVVGVMFVGFRIASTFWRIESNGTRFAILATAVIVAGIVAMVPVLGWLFSLVLTLFGAGVVAMAVIERNRSGGAAAVAGPVPPSPQPV